MTHGAPAGDSAQGPASAAAAEKELKILHLEDSPTDAELVARQLRVAGLNFTSQRVATRETFLRALEEFHPDVVLADYMIPGFGGLPAIRLVRERDADLPVIVLTGALGDEAAAGVVHAGANDYVLKDRLARLGPAIGRAIAEAEQSRARRRAEEALKLSEERYRSLTAATAQIVWTTGPSGEVGEDAPGWRAYTGQSAEEVRGQGWLEALHPEDREPLIAAWSEAVQAGVPYEGEWRVRRHDGQYRYFSTRAVPLRATDGAVREWMGCNIDITERKQREEELERLHAQMAANIALLERHNRQIKIVKNLSDTLQACNSREEAYPFIGMAAGELLPAGSGALAVPVAAAPQLLETAARWGDAGWAAPDFTLEDCWALRRGGMHEPGPGTSCQHFLGEPPGSYACLPLSVRGEVSGLLTVSLADRVDDELRSAIQSFGDTLALCLANLKLRESLQKQVLRDPLTGLLSSQYVDEALPREIRRAEHYHESLSLALLDIDHFGQLNETYGRAAGDQVLSQLGELLRPGRSLDLACRHNGGEFHLVLIGDEAGGALARLQRILLAIREKSFTYRGQPLPPLSVSTGLAPWQPGMTASELIRAASQALEAARQRGGNCVEVLAARRWQLPKAVSTAVHSLAAPGHPQVEAALTFSRAEALVRQLQRWRRKESPVLLRYVKLISVLKELGGQDLIEYALVVALIALAATAGMGAVATAINAGFTSVGTKLSTYTS